MKQQMEREQEEEAFMDFFNEEWAEKEDSAEECDGNTKDPEN